MRDSTIIFSLTKVFCFLRNHHVEIRFLSSISKETVESHVLRWIMQEPLTQFLIFHLLPIS